MFRTALIIINICLVLVLFGVAVLERNNLQLRIEGVEISHLRLYQNLNSLKDSFDRFNYLYKPRDNRKYNRRYEGERGE
jgi:hypothetical protein